MKKQIALLATLIAASGFTAFGQDWVSITSVAGEVLDLTGTEGGTVLGQGAYAGTGDYDVVWLWDNASAPSGDLLSAVGTAFSTKEATPASQQVATNGVSSVTDTALATMLSGGWAVVNNENANGGGAALGEAIVLTGSHGSASAYNSSDSFQISGVSVASGSTIELLAIAVNTSAIVSGSLVVGDITDLGWSNPINEKVGTSSGDPNAAPLENTLVNQFGVAPVPEPTTLALAGLGGLSMLFLRRRKA